MMKRLLNNKTVSLIMALIMGIAIGAIFYPSKSITREETAKYEAKIEKLENEKREQVSNAVSLLNERTEYFKNQKRESQSKMSSLRTENTRLRQKTKETIIKIIRPDGTIEEKIVRTSDTEIVSQIVTDIKQEFNEKVTSIENKWKTIHKKRVVSIKESYEKKLSEKQHIIDTYSKKETIKINERKFGISIGYTNDNRYYGGVSYDIFGPIFLDLHVDTDIKASNNSQVGVGLGFRF